MTLDRRASPGALTTAAPADGPPVRARAPQPPVPGSARIGAERAGCAARATSIGSAAEVAEPGSADAPQRQRQRQRQQHHQIEATRPHLARKADLIAFPPRPERIVAAGGFRPPDAAAPEFPSRHH